MQLGIEEYAFLIITILFGVLVGLFIVQTIKRRRSARALVISLSFGLLACIFAILGREEIALFTSFERDVFQALQLNMFGFQFFFFFIFLERLRSKDLHTSRLALMISLILLQTLSLWLMIYFNDLTETHALLWFTQDMGYTIAGMFVYLGCSLPIYIKTYLYTRERKPLIIAAALGLVGVSFIFSFFKDFYDFFNFETGWLGTVVGYTLALQALGLFIFTIIYLSDIDYLYRLPNDCFMLMVLTRTGIPLHTIKLETRREVEIEVDLLSGMLSAINNVFEEIFKTKATIQNVSSKEVHLLMEAGEQIVSVVITDKVSYFLDKALKRYTKTFEEQFASELEENIQDTVVYNDAMNLIKPIFPFFKVDKML